MTKSKTSSGPSRPIALEERGEDGGRLFSPAAARNSGPILDAFAAHMHHEGIILEIASGTGEHGAALARAFNGLTWLPSDPDARSRESILAWAQHEGLSNLAPPRAINICETGWRDEFEASLAGIFCANMIHIAPFEAAIGLFAGAGETLAPGGRLFLYGPFSRAGAHTAPSNQAFHESLQSRDPRWGVRDLENDLAPLAEKAGLRVRTVLAMPANNLSVIYEKRA